MIHDKVTFGWNIHGYRDNLWWPPFSPHSHPFLAIIWHTCDIVCFNFMYSTFRQQKTDKFIWIKKKQLQSSHLASILIRLYSLCSLLSFFFSFVWVCFFLFLFLFFFSFHSLFLIKFSWRWNLNNPSGTHHMFCRPKLTVILFSR